MFPNKEVNPLWLQVTTMLLAPDVLGVDILLPEDTMMSWLVQPTAHATVGAARFLFLNHRRTRLLMSEFNDGNLERVEAKDDEGNVATIGISVNGGLFEEVAAHVNHQYTSAGHLASLACSFAAVFGECRVSLLRGNPSLPQPSLTYYIIRQEGVRPDQAS